MFRQVQITEVTQLTRKETLAETVAELGRASFVPQGHHGIHFRRAARWRVAGQSCGRHKQASDRQERRRVRGGDAVEESSKDAGERKGSGNADRQSGEHQPDALAEHQAEDIASGGAERHAHPNLESPLRSGIGHHTVRADGGQQQGCRAKADEKPHYGSRR